MQMENKHNFSLGKCKLKPQWDTTVLPLEQLKLKRLWVPTVQEDVEQLEFS